MKNAQYVIADVFTERQFGGNQLAVFTDGRGLDSRTMQDLAREMNFSETTFLLPPEKGGDYRVRIFTPATELVVQAAPGHLLAGVAHHLQDVRIPGALVVPEQEQQGHAGYGGGKAAEGQGQEPVRTRHPRS